MSYQFTAEQTEILKAIRDESHEDIWTWIIAGTLRGRLPMPERPISISPEHWQSFQEKGALRESNGSADELGPTDAEGLAKLVAHLRRVVEECSHPVPG